MTPTIHALRKAGYKVKIDHWRKVLFPAQASRADILPGDWHSLRVTRKDKRARVYGAIHPHGGHTDLWVQPPGGEPSHARASCRADERFNRRLGLTICLGRLVKAGAIPAALP